MFRNSFQSGFLTILYAGGTKPLSIWEQTVRNGHIRRVTDEDVQTLALEIMGTNVATTFISCPPDKKQTLGVRLPFFIMIVKNMKKYFSFEIQILDDKNMSRRFRVSNYQSTTRVRPFSTALPIGLTPGWNQIQFNLSDFTRRAYGSTYLETLRVHIHANIRIRRIFFSDRLYTDEELPEEFRLYLPLDKQKQARSDRVAKGKGRRAGDKLTETEKDLRRRLSASQELLDKEAPSGAPPSPIEPTREDAAAPEPIEFVVEQPPSESRMQAESVAETAEESEFEATEEMYETEAEGEEAIMLAEGEAEMQTETEPEPVQAASELEAEDVAETEDSEIVFTDPISEPEESEPGPSDAELSEPFTELGMDSEPESAAEGME